MNKKSTIMEKVKAVGWAAEFGALSADAERGYANNIENQLALIKNLLSAQNRWPETVNILGENKALKVFHAALEDRKSELRNMGEISEMIQDGDLCQVCGAAMDDLVEAGDRALKENVPSDDFYKSPGYPRTCEYCKREQKNECL